MRITAKADYAVRAAVELVPATEAAPMKAERIADAQGIPFNFLENILGDLRRARIVDSRRGAAGGYFLARSPAEIAVADVIRAVEGPLANVRGLSPDALEYHGSSEPLRTVWVALRANVRAVLEQVTLQNVADGDLPPHVVDLTRGDDAWVRR